MRAEPELGRVQTWLGRSREQRRKSFTFQTKVMSNPCPTDPVLSQGMSLLSAMGIAPLSLGWERVQNGREQGFHLA